MWGRSGSSRKKSFACLVLGEFRNHASNCHRVIFVVFDDFRCVKFLFFFCFCFTYNKYFYSVLWFYSSNNPCKRHTKSSCRWRRFIKSIWYVFCKAFSDAVSRNIRHDNFTTAQTADSASKRGLRLFIHYKFAFWTYLEVTTSVWKWSSCMKV